MTSHSKRLVGLLDEPARAQCRISTGVDQSAGMPNTLQTDQTVAPHIRRLLSVKLCRLEISAARLLYLGEFN